MTDVSAIETGILVCISVAAVVGPVGTVAEAAIETDVGAVGTPGEDIGEATGNVALAEGDPSLARMSDAAIFEASHLMLL